MRGARGAVTECDRIGAFGAPEPGWGQNEAPDHGGTIGGFVSSGRPAKGRVWRK